MTPRVSIGVPVFNGEKYLALSLDSLLAQTFGDFELVISDNASTDGTEAICRRYAALDSRIRYVRRPQNQGGPDNFCHVFALGSAAYHQWSTADDLWHPDFLSEAVAVLDGQREAVLCYPRSRIIDAQGAVLKDYEGDFALDDASPRQRFLELYRRIGLCHAQLGLIRRDAMLKTRLFAGHDACDVDFLGEMALLGKFALLPEVRFFRRMHPQASSWARADPEHQRRFYAPQQRELPRLERWQRLRFQFGAVWRSPIGWADKMSLTADVSHWASHQRNALSRELLQSLRP
jgi:glycosyltransferase involved in cell wall biosynthesis